MKSSNWMGLLLFGCFTVACTGCNPPQARNVRQEPGGSRAGTSTTPDFEGRRLAGQTQPVDSVHAAAAFQFRPVTHPPHGSAAVRPVDFNRLPRLEQEQCYWQPQPEWSAPRPPMPMSNGRLSGAHASGGGIGSSSEGRAASRAPAKRAAKADSSYESAPKGAADKSHDNAPEPAAAAPVPEVERRQSGARDVPKDVPPRTRSEMAQRDSEEPAPEDDYHAWGGQIYLSNDDSMSLSSAQRIIYAIDRYLPLPQEHIRPHELLNYFSFDDEPVASDNDFSVHGSLDMTPGTAGEYTLGLSVSGRGVTRDSRRNTALSLVLDRSGSMAQEGRMSYLKSGLVRMLDELKQGDLVNLVLFDHEVCSPVKNFVVGRDSNSVLRAAIDRLQPRGSTDLNAGLERGYALANASHQDGYSNRVLLISDALTNTGETNPEIISKISESFDRRQIRLSAIGVGTDFNDDLLNQLSERGKGAYVFLGSSSEVDAVFGSRFTSLVETIANDVHFRLNLPPSLRMNVFYGEESSSNKEDVQAIHYFSSTNQLFLSDLVARNQQLNPDDDVMLSIEYRDPETNRERVEEYAFQLGSLLNQAANVKKGRLVMSFVDGLKDIASRTPEHMGYGPGQWADSGASEQCARGKESLREQRDSLPSDPELDRIISLWDRFCSRYPIAAAPAPVRTPIHRAPPSGRDVWPSAQR